MNNACEVKPEEVTIIDNDLTGSKKKIVKKDSILRNT